MTVTSPLGFRAAGVAAGLKSKGGKDVALVVNDGPAAAAAGAPSVDGGDDAAQAIMTTDTRPKTVVVPGDGWSVGGMAKGAGMLAPGLATMLVVLTTDAVAEPSTLDSVLRAATRVTFDR